MLRTENLTKKFGSLLAVDSVDIEVEEGSLQSLIGPNGAGKTTLFNLITGDLSPTEGSIFFKDQDITDLEPHEFAQLGCARSFQITSIFPELTIAENFRVVAQAKVEGRTSMFKRKEELTDPLERAEELIELLDLGEFSNREAQDLSHGQKRTLEIGLSLAGNPELLLLDEPTAGMGQEGTREIIELLNELQSEYTIFLVEHDMDVVMSLSEDVKVLHQGKIIADGPPDEIRADPAVREAYLGEEALNV